MATSQIKFYIFISVFVISDRSVQNAVGILHKDDIIVPCRQCLPTQSHEAPKDWGPPVGFGVYNMLASR